MGKDPATTGEEIAAPTVTHDERPPAESKWKMAAKSKDGDTAMALFNDVEDLREAIDPAEERKLLWRIDLMILPYLAVCYAFFYIDKVSKKTHSSRGLIGDMFADYFCVDNPQLCRHLRHSAGSAPRGHRVQLAQQPVLLWLLGLGVSDEFFAAAVANWCVEVILCVGDLLTTTEKYLGFNIFMW